MERSVGDLAADDQLLAQLDHETEMFVEKIREFRAAGLSEDDLLAYAVDRVLKSFGAVDLELGFLGMSTALSRVLVLLSRKD